MLTATVLALVAAVLHAGWNLAAKRSADRFGALWAQFLVAGVLCTGVLVGVGLPPSRSLPWAVLSAAVHVPYVVFLARAYDRSDFSIVYPVARGGGVVAGALGGAALLHDTLHPLGWVAVAVVVGGLLALPGRVRASAVADALVVAATIGVYSVSDAHGVRVAGTDRYVLVEFVLLAATVTFYGLVMQRFPALRATVVSKPWTAVASGVATVVTYGLVVAAFRRAPVGYVAGLRESSVVLAAVLGWRYLGESDGRRRLTCAAIVVSGVVLLVATH